MLMDLKYAFKTGYCRTSDQWVGIRLAQSCWHFSELLFHLSWKSVIDRKNTAYSVQGMMFFVIDRKNTANSVQGMMSIVMENLLVKIVWSLCKHLKVKLPLRKQLDGPKTSLVFERLYWPIGVPCGLLNVLSIMLVSTAYSDPVSWAVYAIHISKRYHIQPSRRLRPLYEQTYESKGALAPQRPSSDNFFRFHAVFVTKIV